MASFHLNVIRTVFAAGERLAPGLTGRAAFELFCRTPSPRRLTPGERRAVAVARDFMAEARHHRLSARPGRCVAVHEFRPERLDRRGLRACDTVLVVHGWRSRTEYMRALIAGYVEAGFRVVSLDLPGHGASPGRRLHMASAVEAVRVAADWFGPFAAIVGHSFGGAVAVNAAAGSIEGIAPVETDSIVTIASPSSLPAVFARFGKVMGLGPLAQDAVAARVRRVAGRALSEFESREMLARLPIPALVIHDEDDAEVSAAEGRDMAGAGGHVTLKLTRGLGHRRILADAGVVAAAVAFVAGHHQPPVQ